jgi:stage V sporulation protein G
MEDTQARLNGFASVTFDGCFVVHDLKIIDGYRGPFVAMPSRKLTDRCPSCKVKNELRACFCHRCGGVLEEERAPRDQEGHAKLYADTAHPTNPACREMIHDAVLKAYWEEIKLSRLPGYVCRYDDNRDGDDHDDHYLQAVQRTNELDLLLENSPHRQGGMRFVPLADVPRHLLNGHAETA